LIAPAGCRSILSILSILSIYVLLNGGDLGGIVATRADSGVVFPPDDLEGLLDLARFMEQHTEPGLLLGPDGEQVPLPAEVYGVLINVVQAMREEKAISVLPQTQRLTTQEAADFLGISRPTFVKLLERGEIPFEQPGRHRRVFLSDLFAYLVAAAIREGAQAIVTSNLGDFPSDALVAFDLEAVHPDDFLPDQLDLSPVVVQDVVREQSEHSKAPPLRLWI
jgi:excisionase family DNA binding protein